MNRNRDGGLPSAGGSLAVRLAAFVISLFDDFEQFLGVDRLGQIGVHSRRQTFVAVLLHGMGGDGHDRNVGFAGVRHGADGLGRLPGRPSPASECPSRSHRIPILEFVQSGFWPFSTSVTWCPRCLRIARITCWLARVSSATSTDKPRAVACEPSFEFWAGRLDFGAADFPIVRPRVRSFPSGKTANGIRQVNVEPSPTVLSTEMLPCILSTSSRQMARPRPDAAVLAGHGGIGLGEGLEDPLLVLFLDAFSRVADADLQNDCPPSRETRLDADIDFPLRR